MTAIEPPAPLTSFKGGTAIQLVFLGVSVPEAHRLRAMGLREGAHIFIIQNADNLIVSVDKSRIGLRRELAMQLFGTKAATP